MNVTLPSVLPRALTSAAASMSRKRTLVAIVGLAFAVRLLVVLALPGGGVIDNDGTEYARRADSLRNGLGMVGMRGDPMTVFPPLYSLLIGVASLATHDDVLAGRLVSVIAGAMLPVAIFLISDMLFGRRVAVLGALFSGVVPLFVVLSTAVLTDQTYVTFMAFGLYCTLKAYRTRSSTAALAAGLCFGLAYLLRPEGLVLGLALAFGSFALSFRASARRATALLGASIASLASIAVPYIIFTSVSKGTPSFEGKTALNYVIGARLLKGMSYQEAAQGIGDDLTPYGPELNENIRFPTPSLRERIAFALHVAPAQARSVVETIAAKRDGLTPLGALFAIIGFVRSWRRRSRAALVALTTILALMSFASLLAVGQYAPRYGALMLAIAVPFAAKGAYDLFVLVVRKRRRPALLPAFGAATAALALWSAAGLYVNVQEKAHSVRPLEKTAGLWLGAHDPDRSKTVMATSMIVGYYAGGTVVQLPFTRSPDVALAYVARKDPTYIEVVGDPLAALEPYLNGWAEHGIPDRRATLIYRMRGSGRTIALYCWSCSKPAAQIPVGSGR